MGSSTTQEWSDDWGACPYDVEVLLAVVAEGGERFITQGWVGSSEFGVGVALRDGTEIDVQDEDGTEIKDGPFVVLAWSLPVFPGGAELAAVGQPLDGEYHDDVDENGNPIPLDDA